MRASVPAFTRFGETARSPRRRRGATGRSARRAACFSILLLASVATMGGPARGQDSQPDHAAQSPEDEWTQLNARVEDAYRRGEFNQCVELALGALALAEAAFGPDHPNTLISLNNLAALYDVQGRYAQAEPLYLRALEVRERVLGSDHPDTLTSVNNLAVLYKTQSRYPEAEPLYLRALEARERVLGREHPSTLSSVNNLALLYDAQGRYAEAETLYVRALAAFESVLGREHPDTLTSVGNLAVLYNAQGRYAEAEPLYIRALEARERVLGLDHPDTLLSVNNLAVLYQAQGRYAEAEPLYVRALAASESVLGSDHPNTLSSVGNLAFLYQAQGRYPEAEPLYIRALEERERVLGREHPATLWSVNYLADLYLAQGRYAEAEPLNIRALEARERVLGSEHPNTLRSVNNLALLYDAQGRYAEAETLYDRALAAFESVLGREHPDTLTSVGNLAALYDAQGRYAEAEPLYLRALEARERVQGIDHPHTVDAAANLAFARLMSGAGASAIGPARLTISSLRSRAVTGTGAFAEAQRGREEIQRAELFSLLADASWAVAESGGQDRAPLIAESFTALQDATAGTTNRAVIQMATRRVADDTGPRLGTLVRERESLNDQWAANSVSYSAALSGSDAIAEDMRRSLSAERVRIEARMDEIDADLRRNFPQYFALIRPEPLNVAAAQALLDPDEAILMVVPTGFGTHVMAVSSTSIEWVRSEWTQERVDAAVQRLLWDVGASVGVSFAQHGEWLRQAGPGYPYDRTTAHDLYRQIVAPVAGVLAGKRHVFIAAAGSLTSLPFGMLVAEPPQGADGNPADLRATSWFADAHALTQIPSIQSLQFLRRFRRPSGEPAGSAGFVGFGDPVLEGPPTPRGRNRGTAGTDLASLFDPGRTRSGGSVVSLRRLSLMSRLPGTAVELESMRVALGAPREALFLADRATETNLKTADLTGVRILVFATHGLTGGEIPDLAEPGLVFTPPQTLSDADNGFLTASEVSALRLDADWVILSACNTAAGDGSQGAPGLSGLARAFFYAGARNLLASHWPVGDDVAAQLTVRTFQILSEEQGLSRAEAFQRAMREIRNDASHDTADDTWAHPSAWAPFTLIGDGAR